MAVITVRWVCTQLNSIKIRWVLVHQEIILHLLKVFKTILLDDSYDSFPKKTSPQLSWLWAALNGITSGGRYLYGKQNKRVTFLYNNQALLQIAFSEQREEAPVKILLTKVI